LSNKRKRNNRKINEKRKKRTIYIGVNPLVVRNGKLLLGRRKNVFGDNTWGLPGGHLEIGETIKKCAERELYEETSMRCKTFILNNVINQIIDKNIYYLQIGVEACNVKGEPKLWNQISVMNLSGLN